MHKNADSSLQIESGMNLYNTQYTHQKVKSVSMTGFFCSLLHMNGFRFDAQAGYRLNYNHNNCEM